MKDKIHSIQSENFYLHGTLRRAMEHVDSHAACVGWFVVKKDGTSITGHSYESGSTDAQLLGGCKMLEADIIRKANL